MGHLLHLRIKSDALRQGPHWDVGVIAPDEASAQVAAEVARAAVRGFTDQLGAVRVHITELAEGEVLDRDCPFKD